MGISYKLAIFLYFLTIFTSAFASCGGTVRTWDAGANSVQWGVATNWNANNVPNTSSEDAVIVAAARPCRSQVNATIGCLEIQSGVMQTRDGRTLTIKGDYFRNLTANSLVLDLFTDWYLVMDGSAAQTLENVDPLNHLEISNDTNVTFTNAFEIRSSFTLSGTGTTLYVSDDLTLSFWDTFTIPSTVTVEVAAGKTLTVAWDVVVGGTLILNAGASLVMEYGSTLTVSSGGLLKLNGASGNAAAISGNGGHINVLVNGDIWANYFRMDRVGTNYRGLEVNGTIQSMNYGEFHFIHSNGYAMTLGNGATIPGQMDGLGFYDDNNYGNNYAINASNFDVANTLFEGWSGINRENDPNDRIDWGTQAGTVLTLSTNTNTGMPYNPVYAGEAPFEFVIFSFALNQASSATDVTEITFTLAGTAGSGDIDYIQVFDQGATCQMRGSQIGNDLVMSGDPAQATLTIPASTVRVDSTTPHCIHVYLKTTDSAENGATLGIKIDSTADVINSYGYDFSETSGPPISGTLTTIQGDETIIWKSRLNSAWRVNQNWQNGGWPNGSDNCRIGSASRPIVMNANEACQNLTLSNGGEIDWNGGNYKLSSTGTLRIENGFIFTDVGSGGSLELSGSGNQSVAIGSIFPGNVIVNNSGRAGGVVSIDEDSTIEGDLVLTNGRIRIASGVTLTVQGNVTVQTGVILEIKSNATLKLGNGSTLTVDSGGTLEMVGGTNDAIFTSLGAAEVVINGTIKANHYIFDHLGTNGVTINSGAIIDNSDSLINGTFKHPVNNNSTLLRLYRAIPFNTLSNMTFDMNGSSATASTITNIYTDSSIGSGTLAITSYTGDLGGVTFDDDNSYLISWSGASNTIDLTQDLAGPTTLYQGQTYHMGRFAFKQNLAGASYVDADITALTLTLIGTGSSNDIDAVRIYYDDDCNSGGGVLLESAGTFSGNPAQVTFSGLTGATIDADLSNPPTRCIYVEFDIDANATNGATLGVEISVANDVVDDQSYGISSGTPPPVNLGSEATIIGSSTTWTGAAGNTNWFNAGNWNGGVPTASLNCVINSAAYNPTISSGTAVCNSVDIGNGTLTLAGGATLQVYGSFSNSGAFSQSGTLSFVDDGSTTTNQTINTTNNTLQNVVIDKDAGGMVIFETNSFTIGNLTLNGTNTNYIFQIDSGQTLNLTGGVTINAGTFRINSAGSVQVGSGQTILVSGGRFWSNGTADSFPQNLATKAKVTVNGSGTWSFNATSGIVELKGFHFDYLDTNGLRIGGNTVLSQIDGGQFTNLSNSYSSMRAIQLNTTGTIPASSSNVGWNWGPDNGAPASSENYTLAYSSGCASQSIDFTGWFGDWYETGVPTFDVSTKVSASSCTITLSGSATPVSLLGFEAIAYNGVVELIWRTSLEIDHMGFNVYRRSAYEDGLIQINNELIRSMDLGHEGSYLFVDKNVNNGVTYYYYIEDVAINGATEFHGPVSARPEIYLENYFDAPESNSGEVMDEGDSPSVIYENLGGGIKLIAKTKNSIRLQIEPGELFFEKALEDSHYERVSIAEYARTLEGGAPELLQKVILVEIDSNVKRVKISDQNIDFIDFDDKRIAPAYKWRVGTDGNPESFWGFNYKIYSKDKFYSNENIVVNKRAVKIGTKNYAKIIINPLSYNPVSRDLKKVAKATIDIGLDGQAWISHGSEQDSVYSTENGLKLAYRSKGIYRIDFDQLEQLGLEGPFDGSSLNELRVYYYGIEIPIEVISDDEYFSSGDSIRFYLDYVEALEDHYNYAVLRVDALEEPGKRISSVRRDPVGNEREEVMYESVSEENNLVQIRDSMETAVDHFFWKRIYAPYAHLETESTLMMPVNLKGINSQSDNDVEINLYLKGTHDGYNAVFNHHMGLYINNNFQMLADFSFETNEYIKVRLEIPSYYFYDGINILKLKVLGDLVPQGHYDLVFVDKAVVRYYGYPYLESDDLIFKNLVRDSNLEIISTKNIDIFDISNVEDVKKIKGHQVEVSDGFLSTSFEASSLDGGGRYFIAQTLGKEREFDFFHLIYGFQQTLKAKRDAVDMLVIGDSELLVASEVFINQRETEGLQIVTVDINQIYDEFSASKVSSLAIKEFVEYAYHNWGNQNLRYVLILGDASYDYKNHLGYGIAKGTTPIPLVKGKLYDFPSDNWFGTPSDDVTNIASVALGRIPTNDPAQIENYFQKVLAYENGTMTAQQKRQMNFFSDKKSSNENFDLRSIAPLENYSNYFHSRDEYSDLELRTQIIKSFDQGPLLVTFMGHGARHFWAAKDLFGVDDVDELENESLPVVLSFNCSNGDFSDPDPDKISLGEMLVLKEGAGAVAFIGSMSMPTSTAQKQFASHFFDQFETISLKVDEVARLGDLFVAAKNKFGDSTYARDVQNSYVIIGDPSLRLPKGALNQSEEGFDNDLGMGCQARASEGEHGWLQGLFELLFLLLVPFIFRFARRFS